MYICQNLLFMMKKIFKPSLVVIMLLLINKITIAQVLTDALPLNPKVTTGKLPNGITYYILPNAKPEQKVELRLILNSGSVSEDDDQQGLAHMAEHMAFNGTKNFKKNDIVSFLQDIGVGFGSDLNAYTFFDRTVYILPIPTDKAGNLEKGFQVLEDWAHQVSYKTEDIEGERQIILEESRLGKGADDRMQQKTLVPYFNGSSYAKRLPIGIDSIIKTFNPDAIRRYYKDWYRADLMAVAVVGDITKEKAMELLSKHFGIIAPSTNPRKLPLIDFPAYTEDKAIVVTDKEATGYGVDISWPAYQSNDLKTLADYKQQLEEQLFNAMLNARFREITQKPNPPFLFAGGSFGGFVRGYNQFSLSANTGTNDPSKAISVLISEIERVKQFGFLPTELERAKKNVIANYESALKNKDKTESGQLIEEFVSLYLDGDAAPGIENEFSYVSKFVPEITLADISKIADRLKGDLKKFVSITGPEKANGFTLINETQLLQQVNDAALVKVTPYEEKAVAANLLSKQPKAGKIVTKTTNATTGTTDLKLSNGLTVSIKKTDFKDDEIKMQGARFGGSNKYSLKDKYSAQYATAVQAAMGYGNFAPADLSKSLTGKKANANASFSATRDQVSGSATNKDLETMFQLLYLKITEQRKDQALFESFINKNKSGIANLMQDPQTAFIDTFSKFLSNNNPLARAAVPRPEHYDAVKLDRSMQIYKERLGDVTGMHFVFIGSIKEEILIPLIEKYIASLPANGTKTNFVDNKVRPQKGNRVLEFKKGKEEKSLVLQVFSGEVPYSEDAALKAQAMTEALNIKIIEEIREKAQAIYGGGVFGGLNKEPYASYQLVAQLPTGPEKVETVLKSLKGEIEKIQKNGPAQETLDKVKKQWLESHREQMKSNDAWMSELMGAQLEGKNIDRFINYEKYVEAITTKDVQKASQVYLSPKNMLTAVQLPENGVPKTETKVAGRSTKVAATYDITAVDVTIEVVDNATVDGDQISLYFNGASIADKQNLTDKPLTYKVKARKGSNAITMFANNLGTTPPNTAFMVIKCDGKEYKVELSSNLNESGTVVLNLK